MYVTYYLANNTTDDIYLLNIEKAGNFMDVQYVKGDCIFTRTNKLTKQYPYLTQNINTDVIIVGGGITGAILGYYFSKNNIDTVILEKARIGHGSTSITTSLLQYELDSNCIDLKSYTTPDNIIKSYELGIKAIDEIQKFIDKYGNNCDYKVVDSFLYTDKDKEKTEIIEEYKFRKEAGLNVELIDKSNNPFKFDIAAGLLSKGAGAQFDPYRFTQDLLNVGCDYGLRVYENTEAIDIKYGYNDVTIESIYGHKVRGKIVIVASGYNTELFTKRTFGTKTTTFNVATKPINNLEDIYKNVIIRDNEDPYNYLRTTSDNRIIIGGEDVTFSPHKFNKNLYTKNYNKLTKRLTKLFPNLNIDIEYKYCGAFASTKDNLGFIGKDPDNSKLWYCLGYGANGILFALLGGMMLSELYLGKTNIDMSLFKIDRFD